MLKLNNLNYKYKNQYFFQTKYNRSIKINDCTLIDILKKKEEFTETYLSNLLLENNYLIDDLKFLKENNIVIPENSYKQILLNIIEKLIDLIESENNNEYINSIFVFSEIYGYRSINIVKAAIEIDCNFEIERSTKNDMKIIFHNGYIYDIQTKRHIYGENVLASDLSRSKSLTINLLHSHNIKVPNQKLFYTKDLSGLKSYIDEIKYPICIKPDDMYESIDVFPSVRNPIELKRIINYYKPLYNKFVVEKSIMGNVFRLYCCYGEVVGATQKYRKFVIGDGVNTIENLINKKYGHNNSKKMGYSEECSIVLTRLKLDHNSILLSGEKCHVSDVAPGDDYSIFDMDKLNSYYFILVKDVSKAMGINIFAIDLVADSLVEVTKNEPTILEVQENPTFLHSNTIVNTFYRNIVKRLSQT